MSPSRAQGTDGALKESADTAAVKSAARVLELLEFAQQVQRPFKAVELRRSLDWPASSTQMVLQTLVERGYLIFNNDKKQYFPSPRVMVVGAWLRDTGNDLAGIDAVLDEIATETGETVALSIENNFSAQCVAVRQGRSPIPVVIPVGMRAPLTRSAAGLATLMAKSDGQALSAVQKSRELPLMDRESFSRTIQTVHRFRREGRAVVYGRLWADSCFISIPSPRTYNRVAVTISAGGSMATMKRREDAVTEAMLAAIARWRGHSPQVPSTRASGQMA